MRNAAIYLLILTCFSWIYLHPAIADPVISVGSAAVVLGSTFTIPVSIEDAIKLTSWQFDLNFDPLFFQANVVTEGSLMSSFGTTLFSPGAIDNNAGLISLASNFYVDLPPVPFGNGVIANLEFTSIAQGYSSLMLSNVFLNLNDNEFTQAHGYIVAIPEPSTLLLLILGFVALTRRRWNP